MAASLYHAEHPLQPLCRDADGTVRFKANALVVAMAQQHPTPLEGWLADPAFDLSDKAQFVQLLGFSVTRVHALGLGTCLPAKPRIRSLPADRVRHPTQPLLLDSESSSAVLRFKENRLIDLLRNTGPLHLNNLFQIDAPSSDWDQLAQLIGYSHSGAPSYLSDRSWNAADREWGQRKAQIERDQARVRADALETTVMKTGSSNACPLRRI